MTARGQRTASEVQARSLLWQLVGWVVASVLIVAAVQVGWLPDGEAWVGLLSLVGVAAGGLLYLRHEFRR